MRPPLARLELRNVSKTYGDGNQPVEVLHDISLTAEAGSITALGKPGESGDSSGGRVSNTWVISLLVWNNPGKPGLIPHNLERGKQQCAERGARGRLASW